VETGASEEETENRNNLSMQKKLKMEKAIIFEMTYFIVNPNK
jgi:hypothetical protein